MERLRGQARFATENDRFRGDDAEPVKIGKKDGALLV